MTSRRMLRAAGALVGAGALVLSALLAPAAQAAPGPRTVTPHIAGWKQVGHEVKFTPTANQGVTTVNPPGGKPHLYFTGELSIAPDLYLKGWTHIGAPDSSKGYIFDDYQWGNANPTSKLFRVTTPAGRHYDYTHNLVSGEEMNNSWVAISPDTKWMANGEWDTMTRFLVFPTPILNKTTPQTGGTLNLAPFQINLDHPVRNVQGCTFFNATRLLCASDDSATDLFPQTKELFQVDLPHTLNGSNVTGHVTALGQLPLNSPCKGSFEVEGDNYDPATGALRVLVVEPSPCGYLATDLYTFKRK